MSLPSRHSTAGRYTLAVLYVAAGVVLRLSLDPVLGHNQILFPFPLTVVAAALTLGRGPALFASLLSIASGAFFFAAPLFSFAVDSVGDIGALIVMGAICLLISFALPRYGDQAVTAPARASSGSWPRTRRLVIFAAGIGTIGATTKLVLDDFNRQETRQALVENTYLVLGAEGSVLSNLQDAETGQRGFLLTGNEQYLEPYQSALKEVPELQRNLRQLTAANTSLQPRIQRLDHLVRDKYAELESTIEIRRTEGMDAALEVVRAGTGKRTMDAARDLLAGIRTEELRLLNMQTEEADYQSMRTHWVLGIGGVSLIMLLVAAGTWIERDIGERERGARELGEAHQKTVTMLESMSDGFLAFDTNWCYSYVNKAAARMLHRTPEELLGKNLWEMWPALAGLPAGTAFRKAVTEKVPIELVDSYGEPLNAWLEMRAYPSQEGLTLFFTDTTERHALGDRSRLLAAIVEGSDDAIISKDLKGNILTWNQGAEIMYGYAAAEMIGQPVARLIPADHAGELDEIMEYIRIGQKIEHLETERVKKDGQRIFVSVTISPLRDGAGVIVGASSIARDITERKRAEKVLAQSELRYRSLVRAVSQIVWTTNSRGEVVEDLPTWREFTGQNLEEALGWGRFEAVHPDDRARTADAWSRAVMNRSLYETEYRLRRQDGEYRWMAVHGVPVLDEQGNIEEWVGTCADINDRVQAEEEVRQLNQTLEKRVVERTEELQAANKEMEAFAYSVSHDLRAPLRAISGFSRILLDEFAPQLSADAQRYLKIVTDNAVQMGNLIDGLLSFSRLGRQALNVRPIDPADTVRLAITDLAHEQQGRQVEIRIGELPRCEADPLLLRQVFFNLLSNALKYTRRRDSVQVEVGAFSFKNLDGQSEACRTGAPRGVALESPVYFVRDNGAGFDMRYSDKLFGVFQRLHRAEEYEGTGVGLATVRRIVTRHGGHVWAEGAVDQGATFYFVLSTDELPAEPLSTETDSSAVARSREGS